MSLLSDLASLLGHHEQRPEQHAQAHPNSPPPDVTYNPNQGTNIPFSTHDQNRAKAAGLAQKAAFPADFMPQHQLPFGLQHMASPVQLNGRLAPGYSNIQGEQNPGYTPFQSSGLGGPGYTVNLQPANPYQMRHTGIQAGFNPQLSDKGFFYND